MRNERDLAVLFMLVLVWNPGVVALTSLRLIARSLLFHLIIVSLLAQGSLRIRNVVLSDIRCLLISQ